MGGVITKRVIKSVDDTIKLLDECRANPKPEDIDAAIASLKAVQIDIKVIVSNGDEDEGGDEGGEPQPTPPQPTPTPA